MAASTAKHCRMHADWRGCRAYANYHVSPLDYLSAISACIGRVHGIQIAAIVRRGPFSTRSESVEKRIRRIARAISNFIQRKFPLFNNLRKGNGSFDNLLLLLHFVDVRFRFDIDLNKSNRTLVIRIAIVLREKNGDWIWIKEKRREI